MKRSISLILALVLVLSLFPAVSAGSAPAVSSNIDDHFYINAGRFYHPIYSNLAWENGQYVRAEAIGSDLVVETYDRNFQYLSGQSIPLELPVFGGVRMDSDYNFVVVGQDNLNEDDSVEVFRIIRYTKDWKKVDHASLFGANTYIPFDAGSLRFDRSGDILYIRTAHEMYDSGDGLHHQANVMISVRISDMTVTDELTEVLNRNYGYISHSFNQFVRVDGDTLLAVDHGDALPRSVVLIKYGRKAGEEQFYGRVSYVNALPIANSTYHYNDTGVSVGGFECSSTDYLIAGSAYDMSETVDLMYAHRNIFVTATPKDDFTDEGTVLHWLTDYSESDGVEVSPPHLLKLSADRFFLTWTEDGQLKYCFLNGHGGIDGEILTMEGGLSDCVPILADGKIVWYVTDSSAPVFYEIDLNSPELDPNVVAHGQAGDGITWVLYNDGLLKLTGTGEMYDYSYAKSPWYPHRASIRRIEVGEGITSLGKDAFSACSKVTEAALPDTLTRIGASAFYQCKALEEITIPHGVTELGNNAFASCTALSRVDLPDSLRTIGIGAFYKCSALTSAAVPEGVVSLGRDVFAECTALQTVSLPATLTQIGERAFELCRSLTAITVAPGSSSFSHDSQGALYDRNKTTLLVVPGGFRGTFVIPDSVTTVGDLAAEYCSGMTGLYIPDSVTSIGSYAFSYCSLADVTVPESITVIPEGCFYYNEELASISIPETVTEIHGSALGYCEALTAVKLPEGLQVLGNAAFWGCWQLESIVIPEGITELDHAIFYDCTRLKTVKLPSRLRSIDYWCFQDCSSLTDLVLPDTLETIGANAFEGTHSLRSIVFPASLRELSAYSFKDSGLTEMTFLGDAPTFKLGMGLEEYAFGGVTAIAYYPMYNPTWTEEVRQSYSGDLTWVALDLHTHSWQEATCTEPRKCTICGATEGEALGHQEVVVEGFDATCTRDGLTDGIRCGRCGLILLAQEVIPAAGHRYESVITAPTCTEPGFTTHTCTGCGDAYIDTYVPALGHTWDEGVVITEPTEEENGLRRHTCTTCGETSDRVIPALGHTHSYTSVVTDSTCTAQGFTTHSCSCGDSYVDSYTAPLGHDYRSVVTAPGCTEPGFTTHTCSRCGDSFTDTFTDPLGHAWKGTHCKNCGATRPNPFTDVPEDSFYIDPVLWAVEEGITNGTTPTTFDPNGKCQRAQVVTFLWRAAGKPEPTSGNNPFVDVKESDFFYKAVLWAVEQGITNGLDAAHFGPYAHCNRAQVVTFLWRSVGCPSADADNPFTDVKAGDFYYDAVLWAVEKNITNGLTATEFGVNTVCNRAQIVTFLYRTFA